MSNKKQEYLQYVSVQIYQCEKLTRRVKQQNIGHENLSLSNIE